MLTSKPRPLPWCQHWRGTKSDVPPSTFPGASHYWWHQNISFCYYLKTSSVIFFLLITSLLLLARQRPPWRRPGGSECSDWMDQMSCLVSSSLHWLNIGFVTPTEAVHYRLTYDCKYHRSTYWGPCSNATLTRHSCPCLKQTNKSVITGSKQQLYHTDSYVIGIYKVCLPANRPLNTLYCHLITQVTGYHNKGHERARFLLFTFNFQINIVNMLVLFFHKWCHSLLLN